MSVVEIPNFGTLTYNYKIDPNKKYNIVSYVIFKMNDPYKDLKKYTKNLLFLNTHPLIENNNFKTRIYYDDSVVRDKYFKKLLPKLNKMYQLVHYNCPRFKFNGYHDGTFGTLVRYLPFHDFPENDVTICVVRDLDGQIKKGDDAIYNIAKKENLNFIYKYFKCHKPNHIINQNTYVLGMGFVISLKLPLELLISYINKIVYMLSVLYPEYYDIVKSNKWKYFYYGVDEFYLSHCVINYLNKNKIKYGRIIRPDIHSKFSDTLCHMFKYIIRTTDNNLKQKYTNIIDKINKKFSKNYKTLSEFLDIFDIVIADVQRNKQYEYFYKKIINLYKKNPDLEKPRKYDCFVKLPKLYDSSNNLEIFN